MQKHKMMSIICQLPLFSNSRLQMTGNLSRFVAACQTEIGLHELHKTTTRFTVIGVHCVFYCLLPSGLLNK